jgi:MerR family mercuric resistance operon transcriptional regulator
MASKPFTIGEMARAADVPTSTVRYYERAGLLRPSARSASNYRLYSDENLHRLRFIRAAQASGFTLDDIELLLRASPCQKVQQVIEDRLEHVDARMKELRHVRRVLQRSLEQCRKHARSGRCQVVDELSARARRP